MDEDFKKWIASLDAFHLPRWEELPKVSLYKEDVLNLVRKYVDDVVDSGEIPSITPSMVNNYVKWKMIPPPVNKQYDRVHIAYLIVITILKQVMPIADIKSGVQFQSMINGTNKAYNYFCSEQENAIRYVCGRVGSGHVDHEIDVVIKNEDIALKMATLAFASKLVSLKKVKFQQDYL
ncbi:MAG: DUF1836 domain-containing protein [Anaerorhabdus sp.]